MVLGKQSRSEAVQFREVRSDPMIMFRKMAQFEELKKKYDRLETDYRVLEAKLNTQ